LENSHLRPTFAHQAIYFLNNLKTHLMKSLLTITLLFCLNFAHSQTLNPADRPLPQRNMPHFAQLMYADDPSKINYFAVEKAFKAWQKEELKDRQKGAFEENVYEEYYSRWARTVLPFVQKDGSIKLPTAEKIAENDNLRRQNYANDERNRQNATTRGPLSNWTLLGPQRTIFDYNSRNNQPDAPWQVHICALDIAPSNPNVLYCASETGAMNKTTDKGLTWTGIGQGFFTRSQTAIAVHPTDANIVYTGDGNGVNVSTDGGIAWFKVLNINTFDCNDIALRPDNPSVVFAAGSSLQRYSAGGWTNVLNRRTYDLEVKPNDPSVIYALTRNTATNLCEFWKSTDGGATFSVRSNGWISGLTDGGGRLAVSPADPNVIYGILITGNGPRFVKSNDAGESWAISDLSVNLSISGRDKPGGQGYYDLSIAASPTDANKVIFGITSAYRSTDGGANWVIIGGDYGTFDLHPDIQEVKTVGNDTWIATDGGTTYSTDFFVNDAKYRINGLTGTHFWGFDNGWNEDVIVGGRYHNGNTARQESYPTGLYLRMGGAEAATGYVNPANNKMAYFSDIGGYIIGNSPSTPISYFPVSKFPNESYFPMDYSELEFDPRYYNTFLLGKDNQVWKTTDNGSNFSQIFVSGNASGYVMRVEIARSNPNTIYFVEKTSTDGLIRRSTDGGANWGVCNSPTGTFGNERRILTIAVSGSDANTLWVAYRSGANGRKIYKSTDGGSTWTNLTTAALNGMDISDMAHQLGTNGGIYLIGDYGKVFYRNNTMSDWVAYSTSLPLALNPEISRIKLNYTLKKARIASSMGIWEADFYENSTTSFAQPMVEKAVGLCSRDTFSFDSYSVTNGAATYLWSFSGTPQYVSSLTARNPKVVFGTSGNFSATLSMTDDNGTVTKTETNIASVAAGGCDVETVVGSAASCGGNLTKQFVQIPPLNMKTNTMTFSAWIKVNGIQTNAASIFMCDGEVAGLHFQPNTNHLGYHWPSGSYSWDSNLTVPSGEWTHVALVVEPNKVTIYVNGVGASHTGLNLPQVDFRTTISRLMNYRGWDDRYVNGAIDEVCIYNRVLLQAEIREKMHLTRNPSTDASLLAYYQFNPTASETGANVIDRANLNHAILSNGASKITSTAPLGGGSSYRMTVNSSGEKDFIGTDVKLTFGGGTLPNGELVVTKINNSPDQVPTAAVATMSRYYVVRNWGTNASFDPLTSLNFANLGSFANGNPAQYKLYKRNSNAEGATWGTPVANASTGSATTNGGFLNFFAGNNVTSFSQFIISNEGVVPVELIDFQCFVTNKIVNLNWQTASEINTLGFNIERSTDGGQTFQDIGFVKAKGAASKRSDYVFLDEKPVIGGNYYRLRIEDTDGKTEFSPIRSVILRGPNLDRFSIYPNPTNRLVNVDFETNHKGRVTIELLDMVGKVLLKTQFASDIGTNQYPINVAKFAEGAYILKMTDGLTVSVQRLVIAK
jgi:photosystem II stability/assembly factor-like uncharacterized protein